MERARERERRDDGEPRDDAPPAARPVSDRVRAASSPVRCPFCHEDVKVDVERWVVCAACLARHHAGCWSEGARCSACGDRAHLQGGLPLVVTAPPLPAPPPAQEAQRDATPWIVAAVVISLLSFIASWWYTATSNAELTAMLERERAWREAPAPPPHVLPAVEPPPRESPAVTQLRARAGQGDPAAARALGLALLRGLEAPLDRRGGVSWLMAAAQQGDAAAMRELAELHTWGDAAGGVALDRAAAISWMERALTTEEQPQARLDLAVLLHDAGRSAEAVRLVEPLARQGHVDALLFAAAVAARVEDQERWRRAALDRLRGLAVAGDRQVMLRLARILVDGQVSVLLRPARRELFTLCPPDPDGARGWYERLASADGPEAEVALQHLVSAYEHGALGVTPDPARAAEWRRRLDARQARR